MKPRDGPPRHVRRRNRIRRVSRCVGSVERPFASRSRLNPPTFVALHGEYHVTSFVVDGAHRYAAAERCIYCGALGTDEEPLSAEHVLPKGVRGSLVLPNASCGDCRDATSFCELRILRGILNPIRAYLGVRGTKHKDTRANAFPVTFEGHATSEDIPIEEYPVSLSMPVLERPGFFVARDPATYEPGPFKFHTWFAPDAEAQALKLARERGVDSLDVTLELHPREFIKFLAKLAHSFAVAERVDFEPMLTDLIRSPRDASIMDAFHLIGNAEEPPDGFPRWRPGQGGHRVAVMTYRRDGKVGFHSVLVQLFRFAHSPTYEIIVGPARGIAVDGLSGWRRGGSGDTR